MFALGRGRGQAWDALFVSAVSLAIAAIPEALPTVTQAILSVGSLNLAERNAIVKELPSVETLAFTSAINSDKTGTLTMNQMTAAEVVTPTDRYTVSGTGYGLDGKVHHAAGSATGIEDVILPYLVANDARLVDGEVVGDPTEGAFLVLAHKAGLDIEGTHERLAVYRHAAVRPELQTDGHLQLRRRRLRTTGRALLRQGRGPGGDGPYGLRARGRRDRPLGRRAEPPRPGARRAHGRGAPRRPPDRPRM